MASLQNQIYTFSSQCTTAGKRKSGRRWKLEGDVGRQRLRWILDVSLRIRRRGREGGLLRVLQGFHPELPSTAMDKCSREVVAGGNAG